MQSDDDDDDDGVFIMEDLGEKLNIPVSYLLYHLMSRRAL